MAPPRRRRFLDQCDDLEAKRAEEAKVIDQYSQLPLDDSPELAEATAERRAALMNEWNDYFGLVLQEDPESIWIDLCMDLDCAKDRCRAFLRRFVVDSVHTVPALGPEEQERKQAVTSANTLLNVWRCLIAKADDTVLREKRKRDPTNKNKWRLKFMDHANRRGNGPVFEVSKWIFGAGATELGLCTTLGVEKIEATKEDLIIIAHTVWERPEAVPCAPKVRLAFLAMLLLAGIGGFRPKTLVHFPFRQIEVAVVRDPRDRSKTKLAVTFRVKIIKKRRSSRGTHAEWIKFTVFFVPVPSICLASLVTALAIKADAFEPSVDSVHTLLARPNLEGVDYLPLKWKDEMLDARILPLDYRTYQNLWHRACIAAGLRNDPRLYVLRVGAGMDLDGVLADVLRNYVMSNTSNVFQKSYQAEHIRVNLLRVRFQDMYPDKAMWDPQLEVAMRTMSLKRDPNAPVAPSEEDLQQLHQRKDVSELRGRIESMKAANKDRRTWNSVFMKHKNLLQYLSRLVVKKKRQEYFDRVDRLRALGRSTTEGTASAPVSQVTSARLCHGGEALNEVVRYIRSDSRSNGETKEANYGDQEQWLRLLYAYLTNLPVVAKREEDSDDDMITVLPPGRPQDHPHNPLQKNTRPQRVVPGSISMS
ncbi:MAG: hypothetical protein M1821_002359 [Bathelium mastoideum]|nr:MAG: hypothetical protein M1821_002359 [Bathelium mastoideum]